MPLVNVSTHGLNPVLTTQLYAKFEKTQHLKCIYLYAKAGLPHPNTAQQDARVPTCNHHRNVTFLLSVL